MILNVCNNRNKYSKLIYHEIRKFNQKYANCKIIDLFRNENSNSSPLTFFLGWIVFKLNEEIDLLKNNLVNFNVSMNVKDTNATNMSGDFFRI